MITLISHNGWNGYVTNCRKFQKCCLMILFYYIKSLRNNVKKRNTLSKFFKTFSQFYDKNIYIKWYLIIVK